MASADNASADKPMPLAIVGIGCRFPGDVNDVKSLWSFLSGSEGGWSVLPQERYNATEGFYHPNRTRKGYMNVKGGYFLKDVAHFDARFFGITAGEAIAMDPQQRILLECTHEALEDAGLSRKAVAGSRTGVFVTGNRSDYQTNQAVDWCSTPVLTAIATHTSMLANGVSYHFDLRGPSVTSDTACSSSVYALHQAAWSLRTGESDMALLAGCALNLSPGKLISMSYTGLLNSEGRTYAFDERARGGYGCGEGAGVLVLKPLDKAIQNNDRIYSVILESALNHGGRSASMTAPNASAQEQLIREIYAKSNLNMADVGFVEAHAAGTKVGDPVEVQAIYNAFRPDRNAENGPLDIGSVKSHIGHLESVSGIASIMKGALMLYNQTIVPNADIQQLNSKIPFQKWNMDVPRETKPWPAGKTLLSVNNFGFGGANGHCILGLPPTFASDNTSAEQAAETQPQRLFVLSAHEEAVASTLTEKYAHFLGENPQINLQDLAYTLGQRRTNTLAWRTAAVAANTSDLVAQLRSASPIRVAKGGSPKVAFVFTGQGFQWFGMGRELFESYPVFAQTIRTADAHFTELGGGFSLIDEIYNAEDKTQIDEPFVTQSCYAAIEVALVDLFSSWGIEPSTVVGFSSGEIGAAYAAGLVNLKGALTVGFYRGQAMLELAKSHPEAEGTMMAVGADSNAVQPLLDSICSKKSDVLSVACETSPGSCTVAGNMALIDELSEMLETEGIFHKKLGHTVAYHTAHMQLVADYYQNALDKYGPLSDADSTKNAQYYSSRFGHSCDKTDATYWVETMIHPVKFLQAFQDLCKSAGGVGPDVIIEIGPHPTLRTPVTQCLKAAGLNDKTTYLPSLVRNKDGSTTCLKAAAHLYQLGQSIDFAQINGVQVKGSESSSQPQIVSGLPSYPWARNDKNRFYFTSHLIGRGIHSTSGPDILGQKCAWSNNLDMSWRNMVTLDDLPWVRKYRVDDTAYFPLAGYACLAIEAANHQAATRDRAYESLVLRDFEVVEPLIWQEGEELEMIVTLRGSDKAELNDFSFMTCTEARGWVLHCSGTVGVRAEAFSMGKLAAAADETAADEEPRRDSATATPRSGSPPSDKESKTARPSSSIKSASASFTVPQPEIDRAEYRYPAIVHPHNLDGVLQAVRKLQKSSGSLSLTGFESLQLDRELPASVGSVINMSVLKDAADVGYTISASIDSNAVPCLQVKGLMATINTEANSAASESKAPALCSTVDWEEAKDVKTGGKVQLEGDIVVIRDRSTQSKSLGDMVAAKLEAQCSGVVTQAALAEVPDCSGKFCVVIIGTAASLTEMKEPVVSGFRQILLESEGLLCVTSGAYKDCTNPSANVLSGLVRTVRAETLSKTGTLDLQPVPDDTPAVPFSEEQAESLVDVVAYMHNAGFGSDMEFSEENGKLYVPRIATDSQLDQVVADAIKGEQPVFDQPWNKDKRLQLASRDGSLYFEKDDMESLGEDEVEIAVSSTRIHGRDAEALLNGQTDFGPVESAGVVSRKGAAVKGVSIGARVSGLCQTTGLRSFARCRLDHLVRLPDSMKVDAAASMLMPYATAYWAMLELGHLHSGQSVLIAAEGPLRDAAIQIAENTGARIFVVVNGSYEKHRYQQTYRLLPNAVIDASEGDLSTLIDSIAEGVKFDLVATSDLNDGVFSACLASVASFGHVIEMSERRPNKRAQPVRVPTNAGFASFDFESLLANRPNLAAVAVDGVSKLLRGGMLAPATSGSSLTSYGVADLTTTLDKIAHSESRKAHIINPRAGEIIQAVNISAGDSLLTPEGCHVIVGGTGGIGRSISKWMIANGSRTVVLLSRSGNTNEKLDALMEEAQADGAEIIIKKCDVTDKADVEALVEECKAYGGIRGIVQSAMVLRDSLFENLTLADYKEVTAPKVAGTWNLHNALSGSELDFFIMLSSSAGIIGNRGQAAYAAGNTFLDAFARYRTRQGLPAVSIDLGAVEGIGYIADQAEQGGERAEAIQRNIAEGGAGLTEKEILALVSAAVSGAMDVSCGGHCITGFGNFSEAAVSALGADARFSRLVEAAQAAGKGGTGGAVAGAGNSSLAAQLRGVSSQQAARDLITDTIASKLSEVLSTPKDEVTKNPDILTGLDSLTAIEFQNWIATRCQIRLKLTDMLGIADLDEFVGKILEKVRPEWA